MRSIVLLLSFIMIFLSGCDSPQQTADTAPIKSETKAATTSPALFHQSIQPQLLELPNEAFPYWRTDSAEKPALVLFSFSPFLKAIDTSLVAEAKNLTLRGTTDELRRHGYLNTAEPVIMPIQTVTAALEAGLFSKLYWVFSTTENLETLQPQLFRMQLIEQQVLTKEEAAAIEYSDGIFTGTIRGIPFEARHPQRLMNIEGPLVVHVDLGYFRGLYENEKNSPIYSLLKNTAKTIRSANLQPIATTLSYSTLEGEISLELRFIMKALAEMIRHPEQLDAELPEEWKLRGDALLADATSSEEDKVTQAQKLVSIAPESASAQYDLFRALFKNRQLQPSLDTLAKLVELDPGYGTIYSLMAEVSIKAGNAAMGIELLDKAIPLFPENPFLILQKAHIFSVFQQYDKAIEVLDLLPEKWSPVFHDKIPAVIDKIRNQQAEDKAMQAKESEN